MPVNQRLSPTRRRFVQGATASAAIAPFLVGQAHAADAEFVVKLASVAPPGTPWEKLVRKFEKLIEEGSEGRIAVKKYLGGGLGDEISTAEACKRGKIQCWGGSMGALASAVPELECLELPYLFPSSKKAYEVLKKIRTQLSDLLWDRGYKFAVYSQNGFRSIGSTFEINEVKDLKGHKMRSLQNKVHLDTWKAFGASPVAMAITEVLSSLQTGVVDGYDNTELFSFAAALYMATTHWTLTRHCYQPAAVVYSRKWWETLPTELQEALAVDGEEMTKMEERGFRSINAMTPQLVQNFRDAGIAVKELDDSERKKWKAASSKVHGSFEKRTTDAGRALFKAVKAEL
jgi:TRAP-type C4-dicarboxylate transport system substrate-binding protein